MVTHTHTMSSICTDKAKYSYYSHCWSTIATRVSRERTECWFIQHINSNKIKKNTYTNKTCVILPTHWNSYQHFTSMYVFIFARNDSSTRKTTFLIKCEPNKCDWQNKNQTTSWRREITRRRHRVFIDRFTLNFKMSMSFVRNRLV